MMTRERSRESGFTLIEISISAVLLAILAGAFFSVTQATLRAYGEQRSRSALAVEGSRALARLQDELRRTGRVTEGGSTYPYFFIDGAATSPFAAFQHPAIVFQSPTGIACHAPSREVVFLAPSDRDSDGYPTAGTDGDTEWENAERAFTVETAADGVNELRFKSRDKGTGVIATTILARGVERLVVDDVTTNPALGASALRVRIFLFAKGGEGEPIEVALETTILMRNGAAP